MSATEHWWVYIIECEDGALYTGISNHLLRRWQQHTSGRGAKFFNSRKPKRLAWLEYPHDKRSAARREYEIKQLSRAQKLDLISIY
ncbi:MAG: GIY-YIG nuclease family protein [Cellvibrionaceae bacterium]|nr:GIY-YIG nuclease family protein [Cellvibrionaceae bacterium]MCV6626882.1 GIY-YIG nuclease family protein [Cellvibrionaceae bacterium]